VLGIVAGPWQRRNHIRVIRPSDEEEPPVPERELRCVLCDGDMLFEVPPCPDGHDECPELVCTRCGAAEVLVPITLHVWQHPRGRIAPQQRRAAA
jgi:ferredoxin-like protein FixX